MTSIVVQHQSYMKEIFLLLSKQIVDKNSTILSLTPFLDKDKYPVLVDA